MSLRPTATLCAFLLLLTACGGESPPAEPAALNPPETEAAAPAAQAAPPASAPGAEDAAGDPVERALALAAEQQRAVLVDFHAPWCYSCYYMAENVLTGPQWQALQSRVVHVELDADSPLGTQWQQTWSVRAMPSYLLLDSQGHELGRLLGEQTPEEFYGQLTAWLDDADPLDAMRERAAQGDVTATREVLDAFHARYDAAGGLAWFDGLPAEVRDTARAEPAVQRELARLRLMQAASADDVDQCVAAAGSVFAGEPRCRDAYELGRLMGCLDEAPEALRQSTLEPLRSRFQMLVETRVFGDGPGCADVRSAVLQTATLLDTLDETAAADALVERAIAQARERLGDDPAVDRNTADNLRVYLAVAERQDALDAWMQRLIDTWPDEYVYHFRHGRSLLQRGQPAQALPHLQAAAEHAYGINRLEVAEQRVKALLALEREDEARAVASEALKANGPWFPEQAAALRAMLPS